LFADRERQQDEAAVSKLMKDITTGALRRKRGRDDIDLSDEEDADVRRREAKRREFARMRRELLKDEAVGKIAEDKKKEAFLRSIEDRELSDDDADYVEKIETQSGDDSQAKADGEAAIRNEDTAEEDSQQYQSEDMLGGNPLENAAPSRLNQIRQPLARPDNPSVRKPANLAEIREAVSFLIEEPDSQGALIDLGLSDSEEEPEAYINLDRHFQAAEADENADDGEDLGDFIVDDDGQAKDDTIFKKPIAPYSETRAPYSERRTQGHSNVVNRLSMLRQASTSSGLGGGTKMAFYSSSSSASVSFGNVPSLLRKATTNSRLGSMSANENVSATGVVTNKPERGKVSDEKEFIRKGSSGRRNAVNFRPTVREEKMSQRAGIVKKTAAKGKKASGGFLGGLFGRQDSWT
jgi:mediator of replication checkpoint protein 1